MMAENDGMDILSHVDDEMLVTYQPGAYRDEYGNELDFDGTIKVESDEVLKQNNEHNKLQRVLAAEEAYR